MHTQQLPAHNIITKYMLHWFGHLLNCFSCHPILAICNFDPSKDGWRRPRGASPHTWSYMVRHDVKQLGIDFDGIKEITGTIDDGGKLSNC